MHPRREINGLALHVSIGKNEHFLAFFKTGIGARYSTRLSEVPRRHENQLAKRLQEMLNEREALDPTLSEAHSHPDVILSRHIRTPTPIFTPAVMNRRVDDSLAPSGSDRKSYMRYLTSNNKRILKGPMPVEILVSPVNGSIAIYSCAKNGTIVKRDYTHYDAAVRSGEVGVEEQSKVAEIKNNLRPLATEWNKKHGNSMTWARINTLHEVLSDILKGDSLGSVYYDGNDFRDTLTGEVIAENRRLSIFRQLREQFKKE